MRFQDLSNSDKIYLYLGDMPFQRRNITEKNFIGLSLSQNNLFHIRHDITKPMALESNSVDIVQSEDVMEHIDYPKLNDCINEIYRVLKPNGLFRLSMPDYACDILKDRSRKDENGNIIFDAGGGGSYDEINKKVINGGHVWFPTYETVKSLLNSTNFSKINYLHYYDEREKPVTNTIDYSVGWISRTPDHDKRVHNKPLSIVVDCYK